MLHPGISLPAAIVPGDTPACTMAKQPHLHSRTSSYALWMLGWPAQSAKAVITGCYNPHDFTWIIADYTGRVLYTAHGSPQAVFRGDDLLFAWLGGLAREEDLNDATARAVRKAHMRLCRRTA